MNQIKIEIVDTELQIISGTSKGGKPYSMTLQTAYLYTDAPYPEKFEVILPKPQKEGEEVKPYPKGMYTPDLTKSVTVFNGRINFNPQLIPFNQVKAA